MIKDNIGKDLTKVCLPVYFNEPLSSLQKCFEDLEYSYLLDRAYEWGKMVSWKRTWYSFSVVSLICMVMCFIYIILHMDDHMLQIISIYIAVVEPV